MSRSVIIISSHSSLHENLIFFGKLILFLLTLTLKIICQGRWKTGRIRTILSKYFINCCIIYLIWLFKFNIIQGGITTESIRELYLSTIRQRYTYTFCAHMKYKWSGIAIFKLSFVYFNNCTFTVITTILQSTHLRSLLIIISVIISL